MIYARYAAHRFRQTTPITEVALNELDAPRVVTTFIPKRFGPLKTP
jgi:hypothetical protein